VKQNYRSTTKTRWNFDSSICLHSVILTLIPLVFLLFFATVNQSVWAATTQKGTKETSAQLSATKSKSTKVLNEISNRLSTLEKSESLDNLQKSELTWLRQARDFLQKTLVSVDRTFDFLHTLENAPSWLKKIEQELASPLPSDVKIDAKLALTTLGSNLEIARNELAFALRTREDLDSEATIRGDRQQKIVEESNSARKRLDELQQQIGSLTIDVTDKTAEAKKKALSTEQLYLEQLQLELEFENKSYDAKRELLRARRQQAERKVLIAEKQFSVIEQNVNILRTQAAAQTMQAADAASLAAISAHPLVRAIVKENQKLATELTEISIFTTSLSTGKKQLDETVNTIRRQFDGIREKITQIGLIDAVGYKLRADKNQLPEINYYVTQLETHLKEINRVQLRRIEIEDRLLELVDLTRETSRRLSTLKSKIGENERKILQSALKTALNEQKENYLNELIKTYDIYFEKNLFPIMERERELITLIDDYLKFIDTRILWIQSAPSFGLDDVQQFGSAIFWFLNPISWGKIINTLGTDIRNNPVIVITPLLIVSLLLFFQQKLIFKLGKLSHYATKLSKAKFGDTLWGIVVTALIAAPWPLLLFFIGWRLDQYTTGPTLTNALASGFFAISHLLFAGFFIRNLCRKDGLAESHFRWKTENLALILRQLVWFLPMVIPLVFVITVTAHQPTQAYYDSLGRVAFFVLAITTTLLIHRLLQPVTGLLRFDIINNPNGWLDRLSGIWFPALLLIPIALLITTAAGYFYTATQLSLYLIATLYLIFSVNITKDFLIRWLNIAQRKLALEQWKKRNALQSGSIKSEEPLQPGETAITDEAEVDVTEINAQTTKLLNSAFWIAIIIGTFLIWAEVLPAFKLLNEVVLWNTEVTSADSGSEVTSQSAITLVNLILATTILLMTFVISRNIPGLLEIAILQRLPFTPSGRYAITSIVRYVLIIIGLGMTFSAIGVGWSKVQWLAAAITVGLGFGLQEIFANFVSGLIILFERPIRVGDAVTVGDISGKVSRIQMRATTITDWDRKELIIPNKEFVTGQVINWSLSDTILRILIPVGIAYGSDTKLAYDTLLSVARNHPNVLNDPEPTVRFFLFGESSLDFELRVFIPHPDHLLETRHDLHMEIDRRFREANIEIAFPQRDIHIRDISKVVVENAMNRSE